MTIFRHQATGTLPDGETFTFGVHTEKAAGNIAAAHSAWAAAVDDLWNGTATPADSIKQLYPSTITVDELVSTELVDCNGGGVELLDRVDRKSPRLNSSH